MGMNKTKLASSIDTARAASSDSYNSMHGFCQVQQRDASSNAQRQPAHSKESKFHPSLKAYDGNHHQPELHSQAPYKFSGTANSNNNNTEPSGFPLSPSQGNKPPRTMTQTHEYVPQHWMMIHLAWTRLNTMSCHRREKPSFVFYGDLDISSIAPKKPQR